MADHGYAEAFTHKALEDEANRLKELLPPKAMENLNGWVPGGIESKKTIQEKWSLIDLMWRTLERSK